MIKTTATLLVVSLLLSSCATIFTGTSDTIMIDSEPEGARVLINGIEQGRTPATVNVKRKLGETFVELRLDGYENRTFVLGQEFNNVSIINLLCLLCWGVDAATGAIKKYNPNGYEMTLERGSTGLNIDELPVREDGSIVVPYAPGDVTLQGSDFQLVIEQKDQR